ncbi:MAG TPA: hypothetical protein VGP84_01795 [Gemmatimonadaceae bacterium]|jgi:hypothetical protein|nr:hypothetical protein [Gemmatimonadaceae bacterium]
MSSGAKAGKLGRAEGVFDPASYAPVAERISLFYEAFPRGRIITEMVSRTERDVVFRALVYRQADDSDPAATGWAAEREGDGEVNTVACLENTETSAIGRALANLGFTASRERPSAEEMAKASRARAALGIVRPNDDATSALVADLGALINRAERVGLRPQRAARWRRRLLIGDISPRVLLHCERRLRLWVLARVSDR